MEETYEWEICDLDKWKVNSEPDYINECCKFCDLVIYKIKDDICKTFGVDESNLEIGQEDWGWYLLFQENNTIYELDLGYLGKKNDCHIFSSFPEVKKIRKLLLFERTSKAAPDKVLAFAKSINEIAEINNIKIQKIQ